MTTQSFIGKTSEIIIKALSRSKSNATGIDKLNTRLLLLALPCILPALVHIFNFCLSSGVFPNVWKSALVRPLPKVKCPTALKHYRPISILCTLSKVMERIVFDQVSAFLEASNLLDPHQAAYRRGFSTQTALIRTLDEVRQAADSRKVTIAVFFDFSKAFDNVCHELLINKLRCLKFSSSSLRWFCAYLDHRMQAVQDVSNNIMSSFRIVSKGVPQGSVLGPLLFVLYLSDFGEILRHCKYNFYADDLMIYLHAEPGDLTRAIEQLNEDIRHVEDWACRNQLSLNSDKTSAMILGTARYINNISIDMIPQIRSNVAIQFKESVVYLGITISNTLAWDIQVAKTVARVNATLYQLKLCGHLLPLPMRSRLVASLVLPLFDYCCAVLTDITAVLNTKLQRALNACVRYIYIGRSGMNTSRLTSTS